jgi:4-aminobutyrate--pyruvate transaminase
MSPLLPNSLAGRSARHLLHGNSNLSVLRREGPLVVTRGEGIYVYDDAGRKYLEGVAGLWCTSMGFSEPELVKAAVRQLERLPYYHTNLHKSVDPAIELAERLTKLVPLRDAKIFFSTTGSEANDFLVKFAWFYNNARGRKKKKKIIARVNGYHGSTIVSASLTGLLKYHEAYDLPLPFVLHVDDPHYYRNSLPSETVDEFTDRMAANLEELILREGPDTVAGFIAEPCTAAGGVIIPPPGYFEKMLAVLKRHEVMFFADEVVTGFGRTGKMFGCESFAITPDTMTLAKGLSSAYLPVSALAVSGEMYEGMEKGSDQFGGFAHGSTYSGHPVGCAVALRTLELIEERDILRHVQRVQATFARRLERFAARGVVGEVRYCGLLGAIELMRDKKARIGFNPELQVAAQVRERAADYGLLIRSLSYGETLAFCPPLIITESEIDDMFDRVEKALDDVEARLD